MDMVTIPNKGSGRNIACMQLTDLPRVKQNDRFLGYPAQKDILKKKFLKYSTNNTFLLCATWIRAKTSIFITFTT
jgi:hypothetical protein